MHKGFVISDLHLFTKWSVARNHMQKIRAAAASADFFVLNGDIFDFRWTTLPSIDATTRAACEWLRDFANEHPNCRIYYVMGNHDGYDFLAPELDRLQAEIPNFYWHPSHIRIGDALFLHGDVFFHVKPQNPYIRHLSSRIKVQPRIKIWTYRFLHSLRIHRWPSPLFEKRRCAERILKTLIMWPDEITHGVTDIYFGHTHTTFSNFSYGGITFHNSGSIIHGLPWRILPVHTPHALYRKLESTGQ